VLVKGVVDKDERGVKIKATQIAPLDEAAHTMTARLRLRVEATGFTREAMVQLRQTLEKHKGSCRVSLHLKVPGKGEAILALPDHYRVAPSPEFTDAVNGLFGHPVVEPVLTNE
jgi:DNA polymerase-3 subunit alpha